MREVMVPTAPLAVLVNGMPGSGKTTLAAALGDRLRLVHLSRDRVGEAIAVTAGLWRGEDFQRRPHGYELWAETVQGLLRGGASVVAEQLFRRDLVGQLDALKAIAVCVVIETHCDNAIERYVERMRTDPLLDRPGFVQALGFESADAFLSARRQAAEELLPRMATSADMGLPTLRVDTSRGYDPALPVIVEFVLAHQTDLECPTDPLQSALIRMTAGLDGSQSSGISSSGTKPHDA